MPLADRATDVKAKSAVDLPLEMLSLAGGSTQPTRPESVAVQFAGLYDRTATKERLCSPTVCKQWDAVESVQFGGAKAGTLFGAYSTLGGKRLPSNG